MGDDTQMLALILAAIVIAVGMITGSVTYGEHHDNVIIQTCIEAGGSVTVDDQGNLKECQING